MKPASVTILLVICISLFVSITQARSFVDVNNNNNQQEEQDSSISSSGKDTDFFFPWRFFPPWWGHIFPHPHPWPISPAPHGAPSWSWPSPGNPHVRLPPAPKASKHPDGLQVSTVDDSSQGTKNPDFFGWRPFWWWGYIFHHHHSWLPAPHSAPSGGGHKPLVPSPPNPINHGLPHLVPVPPSKGGAELEAAVSDIDEHKIDGAVAVDIEKCWTPLATIKNCVDDIMSAFSSGKVEINSACCSAIKKLESNSCMEKTIGSFNNHRFTTAVVNHCSAI